MYNIGIIGAGAIAAPHKDAVLTHPACSLCAICDIDIKKAQALAEGTECRAYEDYKEMAQNEKLDAVIINLPHFLHESASVYFLEKGISVLVEKPMAVSTAECVAMENAAKKGGAKLAIGHLQRFFPCYRELRKIIENKEMGRLLLMTETRNTDYFTNRPAWFLEKKKAGGGIVMNYCAHTLDKLFYLSDADVVKVCANVDNFLNDCDIEAQAQVLLRMSDGVSVSLSYCSSRINYSYETYLYFTDGTAKIENGKYLWTAKKGEEFKKAELSYEKDPIEWQMCEFVKLLNNESTEIVQSDTATKVISVIEQILS